MRTGKSKPKACSDDLENVLKYSTQQIDFLTCIINAVPDPIFVKNKDHQWLVLNDAFCEFMGKSREELIGKTDRDFFPEEEADVFWKVDDEVFSTEIINVNEETFTSGNNSKHIISTKKSIFTQAETGNKYLVGVIRDVTEAKENESHLKKMTAELKQLSITDELTGLANRRHFFAMAEHELLLSKRNKYRIKLVFVDIDNLKIINDEYGHAEGDCCIIEVANILRETLRESDIIARIGGDEFVILISGDFVTDSENTILRLQKALDKKNEELDVPYDISVSYGFSYSSLENNLTIEELINHADSLMYEHKKGKNK